MKPVGISFHAFGKLSYRDFSRQAVLTPIKTWRFILCVFNEDESSRGPAKVNQARPLSPQALSLASYHDYSLINIYYRQGRLKAGGLDYCFPPSFFGRPWRRDMTWKNCN